MQFCKVASLLGLKGCEKEFDHGVMQKFVGHLNQFGLTFGTQAEFEFRMGLFAKKDEIINEHNAKNASFMLGHNQFSTWTDAEYKKLLGYKDDGKIEVKPATILDDSSLPDSIDWRTKGAVNPVKDQGHCGSCWDFSATCAVEGAHAIKTGKLLSLSEQQVLDCNDFNYDCGGGLQSAAFMYLEVDGQETEADYPYVSPASSQCSADYTKEKVSVSTYHNVKRNSVSQLKAAIAKQPVSISVEADKPVFQHYKSGVLDDPSCGTQLDHAVAAVGYGSENGKEYYIVRNSWTAKWGDKGYIKIAAVDGVGICGIQQTSLYPETN